MILLDYTNTWREVLPIAVARWEAAILRGFQYEAVGIALCTDINIKDQIITACDGATGPTGELGVGEYFSLNGYWNGGRIRFFASGVNDEFHIATAVHEIGHCLGLSHSPEGSDSCMTPIPSLAYPSVSDVAGILPAMPNYPPSDHHQKRHKKKHRH